MTSAALSCAGHEAQPGCFCPCRLAGAAGAVAAAAARAVPSSAAAHDPAIIGPRSQSMEVLSQGREVSTPYMPSKRHCPLLLRLAGGTAAATAAAAAPTGRERAMLRWRRAARAVADAREAVRCLDMLADRLAPPEDRLHAAFSLGMLLDGYGQQQQRQDRLAWALLAVRRAGRLRCVDHMVNELYITGAWAGGACVCVCTRARSLAPSAQQGGQTTPLCCMLRAHRPPPPSGPPAEKNQACCTCLLGISVEGDLSAHASPRPSGERIFTFFTPPAMGQHFPYATLTLLFVLILVYFFMAGQVSAWSPASAALLEPCDGDCALHRAHAAVLQLLLTLGVVKWLATPSFLSLMLCASCSTRCTRHWWPLPPPAAWQPCGTTAPLRCGAPPAWFAGSRPARGSGATPAAPASSTLRSS